MADDSPETRLLNTSIPAPGANASGPSSDSATPPRTFLDHIGDVVKGVGHGLLMSIGEYRQRQNQDENALIESAVNNPFLLKDPNIRKAFKAHGWDDAGVDMLAQHGQVSKLQRTLDTLRQSGMLPPAAGASSAPAGATAPSGGGSGGESAPASSPRLQPTIKVDSKGDASVTLSSPKPPAPTELDKLLDELQIAGEKRRKILAAAVRNKVESPEQKEALALDKAIQMMDARERSQLRLSDEKPVPPNALKYVRLPDGSSPKVGVTWGQLKGQNAVVPQSLMEQFTGALKELAGAQGTVSGQPAGQPASQPIGNTGFVDVTGQ